MNKTLPKILPVSNTVLPESVILTSHEIVQLCELENVYRQADKNMDISTIDEVEQFKINHTTNVGIHYFCIENGLDLRGLASNRSISPEVANELFDKAVSLNSVLRTSVSYVLLYNPIVAKELELFKKIFGTILVDHIFVSMSLRNIAPKASIEVVMFLMQEVSLAIKNNKTVLIETFSKILYDREEEMMAWLKINNPDLIGLPLTWVLKAYDIYE